MWGGGKGAGYVTVYRLAFTDVADVTPWSDYTEGGKIRVRKSIHTFEPLWVTISLKGSSVKVKPHETATVLTWSLHRTASSNRSQA